MADNTKCDLIRFLSCAIIEVALGNFGASRGLIKDALDILEVRCSSCGQLYPEVGLMCDGTGGL